MARILFKDLVLETRSPKDRKMDSIREVYSMTANTTVF
jgi:hypothetical protein